MATTRHREGISLAKGPAAILGLVMIAYGVLALLFGSSSFTTGTDVTGDTFLGLEGNGWTNLLWIAGGALLVLAAPMHWGAKTMAIVVGLALGAAAVIALLDGNDVLGIFAANDATILAWAVVAVALLAIALLPRVGRGRDRDRDVVRDRDHVRDRDREPVHDGDHADRERRYEHRPERDDGAPAHAGTHAHGDGAADPYTAGYRERERELYEEGRRAREREAEQARGARRFERDPESAPRDEPDIERQPR